MKKIAFLLCILTSTFAYSQMAIGKENVSSKSVSLEFGTENRGLLLPWVTDENSVVDAENGTMIFDTSDKKVKIKLDYGWQDISTEAGTTINPLTKKDGLDIQNSLTEAQQAKVSVGPETSTPGILVLEDTNKAMVLPKVASPHLNIINPTPGLLVYDTATSQLAVFNGKVWTFWKPYN